MRADELVLQHSKIRARPQVPKRDAHSILTWFYNNGNAILDDETQYIKHQSDLFSLVPTPKTPLRSILEHSRRFRQLSCWRQKRLDDTMIEDKYIHYSSNKKIDRFIATFITITGIIMIIAPLWILALMNGLKNKLCVISIFILFFATLLSLTTVAKPFESLAATAA